MKKLISGILIGFILTLPFQALASSTIGKSVNATLPFFIDGQKSNVDAIVVEGTSYVPLRSAGDMFGYNVNYSNGEIRLDSKTKTQSTGITNLTPTMANQPVESRDIMTNYYIKSDVLKLDGTDKKITYIERDGHGYVPISVLGNYATWDGTNATITINGNTIVVNRDTTDGIDGFVALGTTYFNIESLGLTATVDGDTLTLN